MNDSSALRLVRSVAWAVLMGILLQGCGGKDPANPDPGPGGVPGDGPALAVLKLVDGDSLAVNLADPAWSADNRWILFTAGPGSTVWQILRNQGKPIPVTNPDNTFWIQGGHAPSGLADGRIAFFQGLIPGDFGMHIMVTDSTANAGEPPADILYRFSGTPVGLAPNRISSPVSLSLDGDARRGVGTWTKTWFLEWIDDDQGALLFTRPATGLETASDFRIGSTGDIITYVGDDNTVFWMTFDAVEAHALTAGSHPSLAVDDGVIGYTAPDGADFVLSDLRTKRTVIYRGRPGLKIMRPVLSPNGRWLAFLGETEGVESLYLGQLLN